MNFIELTTLVPRTKVAINIDHIIEILSRQYGTTIVTTGNRETEVYETYAQVLNLVKNVHVKNYEFKEFT